MSWWSRLRKRRLPPPPPSRCDEARQAKRRARSKLDAARAQQPRVDAEAEAAAQARARNHFAAQIEHALRRRTA